MKTKMFEVRDRGTCVAVIAISTTPEDVHEKCFWMSDGFGENDVILVRCEGQEAKYDPFAWKDRTLTAAHKYIQQHFNELPNHSVIDVRVILNEVKEPAETEIWAPENMVLFGGIKL